MTPMLSPSISGLHPTRGTISSETTAASIHPRACTPMQPPSSIHCSSLHARTPTRPTLRRLQTRPSGPSSQWPHVYSVPSLREPPGARLRGMPCRGRKPGRRSVLNPCSPLQRMWPLHGEGPARLTPDAPPTPPPMCRPGRSPRDTRNIQPENPAEGCQWSSLSPRHSNVQLHRLRATASTTTATRQPNV